MTLLDDAAGISADLADLRHRLHRRPEIGLKVQRTQQAVLEALDGLDLEITAGSDIGSVTAVLRGEGAADPENAPVVLLRADMDALPVHEEVDVAFRSTVDGAMHACGHDLHTAMLVGAARLLSDRRDQLGGDVVLMFQPGEEGYQGAAKMIDGGVLGAAGRAADKAFALHVLPNQVSRGTVASRSGAVMAAADGLFVTARGLGGHAASPHLAHDPVPAICEMVMALQTAITRRIDAFEAAVLTVGKLKAGTKHTVIPDTAGFEATVRTFDRGVRRKVRDVVHQVCHGIADAHGVEVSIEYLEECPVTMNDVSATDFAFQTASELFGEQRTFALPRPLTGTEDFSRVLERVPGAMVLIGACPEGRDPEMAPSNHSPHAAFDDAVLPDGAALYAELALRQLNR
ncbi:M20 family metallopeptidase [Kineosporia rhizophila]|uniref:M20 metallopeptidase family protein n=1 Tax=Kineosporia rhizophila TaxID=84633 RepID=UPI001E297E77|nr:M20 family metallopeptidase [Kineosporia rhizophila]MCE0536763.1 M20 family metallopeptidase [Kineosporia rhizophila]